MLAPAFRGGLRARTSGYAAYRGARTVRRSLSGQAHLQHTPPPRRAALSLKTSELSGARRAPNNANQQPPGHPQ